MIKQAEIQRVSETLTIQKNQVDKDWVLSYLLSGITSMPEMKDILIFKGGTSIKKCWFPNYRFSEDLDFTILDSKFVFNNKFVERILKKATDLSYDEEYNRGILFKIKDIVPAKSNDIEQGFKIFIHYWGADHRKNDMPSANIKNWHHTIKLDINHTEEIIFPVQTKTIFHNYSDKAVFNNHKVNAYAIEEILSEKLRSLIQRKYTSPRDCYDIWYIIKNVEGIDRNTIKSGFLKKMESKKIFFEGVNQLFNSKKEKILKTHWNTQLANQFPKNQIPDYEIILPEFVGILNSLFN